MSDVDTRARALLESAGLVPGKDDVDRARRAVDRAVAMVNGPDGSEYKSIFGFALARIATEAVQLSTAALGQPLAEAIEKGEDDDVREITEAIKTGIAITTMSLLILCGVDVTIEGGSP